MGMYDSVIFYAKQYTFIVEYREKGLRQSVHEKTPKEAIEIIGSIDPRANLSFRRFGIRPDMMNKDARKLEEIIARQRLSREHASVVA